MGNLQRGRAIRVTLGSVILTDYDTDRLAEGGGANRALDVDISVTRTTEIGPQQSTVTIYGLSQRSRDILTTAIETARQQSYETAQRLRTACVQIYAGRPGDARLLSDDWILEVPHHTRQGADYVTTIKCQDGRLPWASEFINETTSATSDPTEIAIAQQKAAGTLGEGTTDLSIDPQLLSEGFGRLRGGVVSFGAPRSNAQTLQLVNRVPIFQRGRIQWVRADTATIGPAITLLEGRTALIVGDAQANGFREVTAPLDARLELGRQIFIRRTDGRKLGPFRVDQVQWDASTRSGLWEANLLLRPSAGTAQLAEVVD